MVSQKPWNQQSSKYLGYAVHGLFGDDFFGGLAISVRFAKFKCVATIYTVTTGFFLYITKKVSM